MLILYNNTLNVHSMAICPKVKMVKQVMNSVVLVIRERIYAHPAVLLQLTSLLIVSFWDPKMKSSMCYTLD